MLPDPVSSCGVIRDSRNICREEATTSSWVTHVSRFAARAGLVPRIESYAMVDGRTASLAFMSHPSVAGRDVPMWTGDKLIFAWTRRLCVRRPIESADEVWRALEEPPTRNEVRVALRLDSGQRRAGASSFRATRTTDMAVPTARIPGLRGWAKRRCKVFAAALLRRWFLFPTWRMEASAFRATGSTPGSVTAEWEGLVAHLGSIPADQVVEVSYRPGYVDDELRSYARYVDRRREEIEVLTSQRMKAALAQAGVELVSFRDLSP